MSPIDYFNPDFKIFLYWGLHKYSEEFTQEIYATLEEYGLDYLDEFQENILEDIYNIWLYSDFEDLLSDSRYPEGLISYEDEQN